MDATVVDAPDAGAMVTGAIRAMADRLWHTEDGRASGAEARTGGEVERTRSR